jgi:hypothetical protein
MNAGAYEHTAIKCPKCGVQLRKPKRSFFGKIIKWLFILFNAIMLIWLISGLSSVTEGTELLSEAEQIGTAIGAGLGVAMLAGIWVIGDIILGLFVLFTRPKA